MFIQNLKISKTNSETREKEIIRNISFQKGINLIMDETPRSNDIQKTGNSVGKTTVLRLVDYCLGGSGKNIYTDPEFKEEKDSKILEFLRKEKVLISLTLVDQLGEENSNQILIERNFLEEEERICRINGKEYPNLKDEFQPELKKLIFHSKFLKPTFRQIISKNIRDEKNKLINVVRTLYPTTSDKEYESLYLFWLGIELESLNRKQDLVRRKGIEKKLQSRLKREGTYSKIIQSLLIVEKNLLELEERKKLFEENKDYEKDLNKMNLIKRELNRLSTEISQLELRKELINESKEELEKETSKINVDKIERVYKEANSLIPSIQKSFNETLEFHNGMVKEKLDYIIKELPSLDKKISQTRNKISKLVIEESELGKKMKKIETKKQYEEMIIEINKLYEKKGKFEEQKRIWENSKNELEEIEKELESINKIIKSKEKLIQERTAVFNEYFSDISNKLYGEKFILSADKEKTEYELNVKSIEDNPGTGKKKGLIVAFDFAYVQFADSLKIPCLHFILHDQIENVHENQITNILTEIIQGLNCQFIMPVLKDKLPRELDTSSMEILKLSQNEKLFKIK